MNATDHAEAKICRAEEKRILSLAGQLHEALSAVDRDTLTLGQIRVLLEKAELLAAAVIHKDTVIEVLP